MQASATGRARETGVTVPYMIEVPADLAKQLEEIRKARRWTKRALFLEALERFVASENAED